ncbi:AAA family ATPase [Desulfofustis glycolicus]|uniref:DNA sulfur modification protein DndD n=1 Tax=Desulfofustis glycolicus DSM 9705 TaxID=1121409 RepID=A0A1M5UKT5_9BACT|nr:AAA family ATPase [Desulfofustis glycolicus]SHH63293.1 DNA sulfur modification protein DndD [Desulfofustis glycolicus DSM 9705]
MASNFKILGWKSEGLRCPDHNISFTRGDSSVYEISLIQMPNGTGKTTVLNLLRAALSGSAYSETWNASKVRGLKKRNSDHNVGSFEVKLSLNDRPVTIIMQFDFDSGKVIYKTTRGEGQKTGFDPPSEFKRFLNENFVNFFVFDGELAQNLLDSNHTKAEKIVDDLFQISTLLILNNKIDEYWQKVTQDRTAKEWKGFKRRASKLTNLKARLENLEKEQRNLNQRLEEETERLVAKENIYKEEIKKGKNLNERHIKAETDVKEKEAALTDQSKIVLDNMADCYSLSDLFSTALYNFKVSLDRVKLPESAAREFFEELAEEDVCVCDRPIDENIRKVILEKSIQYLGSDDVSLLNAVKTAITEALGDSRTEPEKQLKAMIESLSEASNNLLDAKNELDEIKIEIAKENPDAKKAQDEIEAKKITIRDLETQLERFKSDDTSLNDENTYGIEVLRKRVEEAEEKLAEIANTMILRYKRDRLQKIITNAYQIAHDNITNEICSEANDHINDLMPYNDLSIDRIDSCLVLKGQTGGSTGEQLSIAYAFLSTLFNRSEHKLPFVVDSPANPIDLEVRPKIGAIIPKLSEQFIAFTISSERSGFVDAIVQQSKMPIQFLTLFRKGRTKLEDKITDTSLFNETDDGFCILGKDYFDDFQLDYEE